MFHYVVVVAVVVVVVVFVVVVVDVVVVAVVVVLVVFVVGIVFCQIGHAEQNHSESCTPAVLSTIWNEHLSAKGSMGSCAPTGPRVHSARSAHVQLLWLLFWLLLRMLLLL